MKLSFITTLIIFSIILFTGLINGQETGSKKAYSGISIPEKTEKLILDPLPAGTYSVGSGGYFTTINSAFDKLSADGIAGEVILELTDDLYTAPVSEYGFLLNGPIPGAGPANRVIIRPAENKQVTIEGSGHTCVTFLNTSYVTIDGVNLEGTTSLTFHSAYNSLYNWNDGLEFLNNSDFNIIQNITFISDDLFLGGGLTLMTLTGYSETCDSNIVQNNFFKKGANTLYLSSNATEGRATGNIIRNNIIGSETDSLIAWGIQIEHTLNTIVENNIVRNLKITSWNLEYINFGINSYQGYGDIIRNNTVYNIKNSLGYTSTGILLSAYGGYYGIDNLVYNNMVFDIQSSSPEATSRVAGIQMWVQVYPKIYYNSVYLSGTGANHYGSGALYILNTCSYVEIKNNILVNTRDESTYCSSALYLLGYSYVLAASDYNNFYYDQNNYNCLVHSTNFEYNTLSEWQAAEWDSNSVSEMPNFNGTYLHIDESKATLLESGGIPIPGIGYDFDGDLRSVTNPDIGADEFDGIVIGIDDESVRLQEFALEQNYPNPFNPLTTIGFSILHKMNVKITVMNVIGEKVAVILNDEREAGYHQVEFNAVNLSSGVYFYRIEAGDFVQTKKMILLK